MARFPDCCPASHNGLETSKSISSEKKRKVGEDEVPYLPWVVTCLISPLLFKMIMNFECCFPTVKLR